MGSWMVLCGAEFCCGGGFELIRSAAPLIMFGNGPNNVRLIAPTASGRKVVQQPTPSPISSSPPRHEQLQEQHKQTRNAHYSLHLSFSSLVFLKLSIVRKSVPEAARF